MLQHLKQVLFLSMFYKWVNWGTRRLSDFSKHPWLVIGCAWLQTHGDLCSIYCTTRRVDNYFYILI
jgi:hypothetical protein